MAFPKSFLLLGLLFALAFLISSLASARELVETAQQVESAKEIKGDVHEDGYGYYGHHDGHGHSGYHGGHHGHYPPEKTLAETDGYGGYGGYGHGGYGGYGHGGSGYGHGGYGHGGHGHYGPPKDEEKKN